jgi:hypothetical protein
MSIPDSQKNDDEIQAIFQLYMLDMVLLATAPLQLISSSKVMMLSVMDCW